MIAKNVSNASLHPTTNQREVSGAKVLDAQNIKIFDFNGSLFRGVIDEGEPLLFANDICQALGYSNPRDALSRFCRGVVKRDTPSTSGIQTMNFLREPDLYRLIFRSKKPEAEAFADFVYEQVLPSIRRTGYYSAQNRILPSAEEDPAYTTLRQLIENNNVSSIRLTLSDRTTLTYDMRRLAKAKRVPSLSKPASRVLQYLKQQEPGDYPFKTLREALGISMSTLSNAIYGRNGRNTRGLMQIPECAQVIKIIGDRNHGCHLIWRTDIQGATA